MKPENCLLDLQNEIKVVDFGLSNMYASSSLLQTACGSPCYAAPEMIAGLSYNPLCVDIWSLGIILYALLCGYLPFDDQDTQFLYTKILNCDYEIPPFVNSDAKELIRGILNVNPNERYTFLFQVRNHAN